MNNTQGRTLGNFGSVENTQNETQNEYTGDSQAQNVRLLTVFHLTILYGPVFNWDESIVKRATESMNVFYRITEPTLENILELPSGIGVGSGLQRQRQTRAA